MHSATALEEQHISGPGNPLQLALQRRLVRESQSTAVRHTAGEAAADS